MVEWARRVATGVVLQRKLHGDGRGWLHVALTASFAWLFLGSVVVQVDGLVLAPAMAGLGRGAVWQWMQASLDAAGLVLLFTTMAGLVRHWRLRAAGPSRPARDRTIALLALVVLAATGLVTEGVRLARVEHDVDRLAFAGRAIAAALHSPDLNLDRLYHGLWSLHLLAALVFLAVLPWTFLRHALLAPLAIGRSSPLPHATTPIPFDLRDLVASGRFDITVGLESVAAMTTTDRLTVAACTECRRCTDACPVHACGSPLTPSDLVRGLNRAILSHAHVLPDVLPEAAMWSCAQCGACDEACPVHVHPRDLILDLRRSRVGTGKPDPAVATVLRHVGRVGNPYGRPPRDRSALVDEMQALGCGNPSEGLVYWLGCAAAYDRRVGRIALATGELLRRAGVGFTVLGASERCCGEPVRRLGEEGRFQELALVNIDALKRLGTTTIVTHCAHCHHVLGRDYPQLGAPFRVLHHASLLAELVERGRLVPGPLHGRWTVHDACNLGRQQRLFDPPRRTLRGAAIVETPGAERACCGGGGGRAFTAATEPEPPALRRLRQAKDAGADGIVTECPFCVRMFDDAVARESGVRVADVAELLLERCGGSRC